MNCPICNNLNPSFFRDHVWTEESQEFRLLNCPQCELIWTHPLPDNTTLKSFYARAFDYDWYADHLTHKRLDVRERVRVLKPVLGSSSLDYGGGFGYFSDACKNSGISSEVYDPYLPGANRELSKQWDSVVALHSLEHSNDLEKTLTDFRRLLNPGGRLIISVPNAHSSSYQKKGMAAVWAQPPLLHIFHFSEKNIRFLLERHGFEVEDISYADRWDANYVSDVLLRPFFFRMDSYWAKLKNTPLHRPYAVTVGFLRQIALRLSRVFFSSANQELNVVCKVRSLPSAP